MLKDLLEGNITQNEYLNSNDVTLLYEELPKKIYGFIFKYKNRYVITINNNMSINKKKMTILHELSHLELSHLDNRKRLLEFKIENIEDEADKYIEFIIKELNF